MKRFVTITLISVAIIAVAFFVAAKYYPEQLNQLGLRGSWWPQIDEQANQITTLAATINLNLDSDLAAVLKDETEKIGVAVFTENNQGTEQITELLIKDTEGILAVVKINPAGQPSSLEYRDYLLLFDDYADDNVKLTVRRPNKTYDTARNISLVEARIQWPSTETIGLSRWDVLEHNSDTEYRDFLRAQIVSALDIVACAVWSTELLPQAERMMGFANLKCGRIEIVSADESAQIAPCVGDRRTCAVSAIDHLETLRDSTSAATDDNGNAIESADEISVALDEIDQTHPTIDPTEQLELFDLMTKIDAVGTLIAKFGITTENSQGLTETDEGVVSVSFAGNQGTCKLAAKSTTIGTPNLPVDAPPDTVLSSVSLIGTSTSTICTGTLNEETGQFTLEGMLQTNTTATTGLLGDVATSGVGAFHIIGLLQDQGITGTIFYANKALDLRPQ
ncbi:MAG: hypothetical protein V1738_02350 [Patescibacteria group bacterium]